MSLIEATCPKCHQASDYGAELMGRYTLCNHCGCRFYVEVPTLAAFATATKVRLPASGAAATPATTTLDDLLWDTQQGSNRLSELLRQQQELLRRTVLGLIALLAVATINLILTAALLWR